MKEDVFANPLDVGLLCAVGVLFEANIIPKLVEEFFWFLG